MSDPELHRLIGCDWGHKISDPHDQGPCPKGATRRVALHIDANDIEGTRFKFCDDHLAYVTARTSTRTDPVVEGPSPELAEVIRMAEELLATNPPPLAAAEIRERLKSLIALRDAE